ncbi:hypothetical protein B0T16DRAFT_326601 [Cercophora newfieldiana]|uniref:Uncharacterized protein n=1 Tax=Cercophora newfieldiana TaxID=92897 RepID=A0AA40CU17_9PEZI|nr:hypothetical protein B0T16DRAFT_326601 [Cercophora newfieldiana]
MVIVILFTNQSQTLSDEKERLPSYLTLDVSTTLTIVRAMQGILTMVVTMALSQSFAYLQWGFLRNTRGGAPYIRQLALSPTTSVMGTTQLIFHPASGWGPRFWGFLRLLLFILVGLGGVVLFFRTSLVVVFDTAHSYEVTAGFGPFNASYIDPFFDRLASLAPGYPFSTLPYSFYGPVHDLITNPFYTTTVEPTQCQALEDDGSSQCAAYLLSGGVAQLAPWVPTGYADHPQILVKNVPAIHAEFSALPAGNTFDATACQLFGSNTSKIAIKFCLAQPEPTKLDAGIFVCAGGIADGECQTTNPAPNITTSLSFFRRYGTVLGAKSNMTIIEASNFTAPEPVSFSSSDVEAYRKVLAWLLDYSAADIPAPSSIVETFWSAKNQLQDPISRALIQRNFRSVLVFPLWLFNANNYGNKGLDERIIQRDLPPEFYTTASLVKPYTKIKFDPGLVATFIGFQAVALVFAWFVLFWTFSVRRSLPEISSYPLFDVEFKAEARGQHVPDPRNVWGYRDKEILDAMGGAKVERRVV